jgi:YVTN family beta-propeller protein
MRFKCAALGLTLFAFTLAAAAADPLSNALGSAIKTSDQPAVPFAPTTIAVGDNPAQIAVNPVTNRIYVANLTDNTVSVIDGNSNTVTDTVSVGSVPEVVGVNPTTNMIYVANSNGNSVSVIDGSTDSVVATIPSNGSTFLAVNAVTNTVYVGNQLNNTLNVIDANTNTVVASVSIPNSNPGPVVVDPSSNLVYLSATDNHNLVIISGSTNTVVNTVAYPGGGAPSWMTADLDRKRIYCVDVNRRAVYVLNTATNTFKATVDLSSFNSPYEGAVMPSHELVVSNYNGGSLIRINPSTLIVDGTWGNGRGPSGIAINPITNKMYVSDTFSNIVTVISLK